MDESVEAERRVLDAIDARQVADFSSLPAPQRVLSAEFLQALISGSHTAQGELCCPLRIRGAEIVGPLRPPTGLKHGGNTALQFRSCHFRFAGRFEWRRIPGPAFRRMQLAGLHRSEP